MKIEHAAHARDESILAGVPKVQYGPEGVTPFPLCLKSCAGYIGIDTSYDYTMAASGAAFRLTWDETQWNLGNVDAIFTYKDPERVFRQGIEALGGGYAVLWREEQTSKAAFIAFIKEQIDKGYPVIALGIIGPPEACIVTGYQKGGDILLGWNFFQDMPAFNAGVAFDECGYFKTGHWWDNPDTVAVMAIHPVAGETKKKDVKGILSDAIEAMTGRREGQYAKGIRAYDSWAQSILDDTAFPSDLSLPLLEERLSTHADAIDCIADGRYHAAVFMQKAGVQHPEQQALFEQAAAHFMAVFEVHKQLFEAIGGWERGESQMRKLAQADVRKRTAALIHEAKKHDKQALEVMQQLYTSMRDA